MSKLPDVLKRREAGILTEWLRELKQSAGLRGLPPNLEETCRAFLVQLAQASRNGNLTDIGKPEWNEMRHLLEELSVSRARQGDTPSETAGFVFSLKQPLFAAIRDEAKNIEEMAGETWMASRLLDSLGLYTTEVHQKGREDIIQRQQAEMMELSTPVVRLWEGILALPLIGTLDSERTQTVMESLLEKIVETGAAIAIIDITGVPTVDTLVAQHLLKTVAAARLMGADCIISGIRPQIAQTIVHLGVGLGDVITKASMADAFSLALKRSGYSLIRHQPENA
ncbi:MAG: STAS domain-containing protein [Bryobacterales bacterium]|nr:STAS domain-containing protein [Bryobacterales bacterium]